MDAEGIGTGIAGIAILLTWYALAGAWLARRRHVPAPPEPDAVLSPAEIRFLHKGACDGRTLLVAILDLVARNALSLKRRPNGTAYVERSLETVGDDALAEDGRIVRTSLFRAGNRMVDLTDAREDALLDTGIALRNWLDRRHVSSPRLNRFAWFALLIGGPLISVAMLCWQATSPSQALNETGNVLITFFFFWFALGTIWGAITCLRHMMGSQAILIILVVAVSLILGSTIFVFTAGRIGSLYEAQGLFAIVQLALPIPGIATLIVISRPIVSVPNLARRQLLDLRQSFAESKRQVSTLSDIIEHPKLVYAVALDCAGTQSNDSFSAFDGLKIESSSIDLFGSRQAPSADLGSLSHIASRVK